MRVGRLFYVGNLAHQLFIDGGAPGGIEHHHVVGTELGGIHGAGGDLNRGLAGDDRQRRNAGLLAKHFELFLGGRAARVERRHQDFFAVALLQTARDLRRRCRLTRALQADHQDRHRRQRGNVERLAVGAEHLDQLVVHDLDDHLARRDRLDDLLADGLFLDLVGK